ncbi:MAG: hypothetical protein B6229_10260 [Spirochaetaceae bacterium 4572_7]|nr:MAG: hypothetical protein B6229_10260 [Spirochaetaceae bacterium 4572_7]
MEKKDIDSTIIYKTLFKLLNHDTRNTFVKLNALISDLGEGAIKDMISDSVRELNDIIESSQGFLDGKKRILSIYDMVSELTITKNKINLTNHDRIHFSNDPKIYLYAEVSELFHHAILNIIENALKYSPPTEVVDVTIKRIDESIILTVADKGIGIETDQLEKIFDQGYRAPEVIHKYHGTGTGLWITKNIICGDGGSIDILNNKPQGTIFRVTIPAFHTEDLESSMDIVIENYINDPVDLDKCIKSVKTLIDMHAPPENYHYDSLVFSNLLNYVRKERRNKNESHFKEKLLEVKSKNPDGRTVLIVDDSSYVHYYLGSFFCELGYRVVDYAENGREACSLYSKYKPDVVSLDITMPVMSGLEASEKILEEDPDANLLFLSGLGNHRGLIDTIESKLGDKTYSILTKPFTIDKLEESLKPFNLQ